MGLYFISTVFRPGGFVLTDASDDDLSLAVVTSSAISGVNRLSCHSLSVSIDLFASLMAFNAYSAALKAWSAMCAVAAACPSERATAISHGSVRILATVRASRAAFRASPAEALSLVHSLAT